MNELDWGPIDTEACVLRCLTGPYLYGIEDPLPPKRDEVAVIIEPAESVIAPGLFVPYTYESADLRLTELPLREFVRRLLAGNLTTLIPLLAPERGVVYQSEIGEMLFAEPQDFLREQMHPSILGYLRARRAELARADTDNEPYDAGMAFTVLRVAHQAIEVFEKGLSQRSDFQSEQQPCIALPTPDPLRTRLREVLGGKVGFPSILTELDQLIDAFRDTPYEVCTTPLDLFYNHGVVGVYLDRWRADFKTIYFE